ncbi:Histone-lysine N-methyltransferase SUVR5 [Acorus calamus]|uniref:Histone-lysine N-methyltransferase SUVR5 n=1 Tax=Acorus calamus TaxID=4465 RepID=A0AAV9DG71_ACOCL|nr:Histone-lysine N-methyltransferase SUVR5 [Acorus calamus]
MEVQQCPETKNTGEDNQIADQNLNLEPSNVTHELEAVRPRQMPDDEVMMEADCSMEISVGLCVDENAMRGKQILNNNLEIDLFGNLELLPFPGSESLKEEELANLYDASMDEEVQKTGQDRERVDVTSTPEAIGTENMEVLGEGNLEEPNKEIQVISVSEKSYLVNQDMDSKLSVCDHEDDCGPVENECNEQDDTVAIWVKWRGKWQAGIRCARADCPLPTLRAKPTHDRKIYLVVFFPHTRTHSWADTLLVRSINELPEPLVYGTHLSWMEMVKDLTIPRRYIMQKLAVAMMSISDQLHTEAVIESACKVTAWKEFSQEASLCEGYSDLGRMLLKLQSMIRPTYINPDWLEHFCESWVRRCQNAQSAEIIEILTEELVDSVLWEKVEELWDAPTHQESISEWKSLKRQAAKWFSTSNLGSRDVDEKSGDSSGKDGTQICRKRQKLEVRRADMHSSQIEPDCHSLSPQADAVSTNSGFSNYQGLENAALVSELHKKELSTREVVPQEDKWDNIVVDGDNTEITQTGEAAGAQGGSGKAPLVDAQHRLQSLKKYRQCLAFSEAKGRQCGRWANDGDVYCCVHLNTREKPSQISQTTPSIKSSMCEGTTNNGKKCKHHARNGSVFCKKHHLQGDHGLIESAELNVLKRKHDVYNLSENFVAPQAAYEKETVMKVEDQTSTQGHTVVRGESLNEGFGPSEKSEDHDALFSMPHCIGFGHQNNGQQCLDTAKLHDLYCEKHLPRFLKRARNGKPRIISKEVFKDLVKSCTSRQQKILLHRACELLYGFMKSSLSHQISVSKGNHMEWILSETSKDLRVGEYLLKLVTSEREKIGCLWAFNKQKEIPAFEAKITSTKAADDNVHYDQTSIKCKICTKDFPDGQVLGVHFMEIHKKEAQWLFRGYACGICKEPFTNRKVLEVHAKERHGVLFLEQCLYFRCISCSSHFVSTDQLWLHALSLHSNDLKLPISSSEHNQFASQAFPPNNDNLGVRSVGQNCSSRYTCRFCGLKFDLLPDLGRHHQAAHMAPGTLSDFPPKKGNLTNVSKVRLNRRRLSKLRKVRVAPFQIKNPVGFSMKKRFCTSKLPIFSKATLQTQAPETTSIGRLMESDCADVANTLFAEIKKTKPRPSNQEIISTAHNACCRFSLHLKLEEKYGTLPERLYVKAAKLCSDHNILVGWHLEGFICPKGCKPPINPCPLAPLDPLQNRIVGPASKSSTAYRINDSEFEMDECHYILNNFKIKASTKAILLCEDVSFGKEQVPVACIADEDIQDSGTSMPWQGFTYVTKRVLEPALDQETKSSQLGCDCQHLKCSAETCDHVYLFDNDYEDAKDIYGKSMHGRFPYEENRQIILQEGYFVYECNSMCRCDSTCQNRVLQNGLRLKLEIFRTDKKGWGVRAGEEINRGTFVCEYIGEVLNDLEINKRRNRYHNDGLRYLFDINAHINNLVALTEGTVPYMIDASKYGNIARFINHSCLPNLVIYLVLVDSMDCQLAHVGFYANRDIAAGEELTYDYRYTLQTGEGCPCHCGALNCRGRVY